MPCDSRIEVRIADRERFLRVLKQFGAEVHDSTAHIRGRGEITWRTRKDGSLLVSGPPALVERIQDSYAAASVGDWAEANGWTVEKDPTTDELVLRQWENS